MRASEGKRGIGAYSANAPTLNKRLLAGHVIAAQPPAVNARQA
jgi:hypothetical protein